MTDISAITGSTTSTTNTNTSSTTETLGQDQFLTLLVAQLQNQDPLNPSDATEFTSQLAQYSELEQLFSLNDSMDALVSAQANSERLASLSMIGQEVVVEGDTFNFDGEPMQLGYSIDGLATGVTLSIKDSSGNIVASIEGEEFDDGIHYVTWDGTTIDGEQANSGEYTIQISAESADSEEAANVTSMIRIMVSGVDLSGTEPILVTSAGEYTLDSIRGTYQPENSEAETEEDSVEDSSDYINASDISDLIT